jgi:hypothetical protein
MPALACLIGAAVLAQDAQAGEVPEASTYSVSSAGETSATVEGYVSPATNLVSCRFEWGLTPAFGQSAPCVLGLTFSPGSAPVSALLSGLKPGTEYDYRLAASSESGTGFGLTYSFVTLTPPGSGSEAGESEVSEEGRRRGTNPSPRQSNPHDVGLYVHYCAAGQPEATAASAPMAKSALANHTGWPKDQCLKMDKGSFGHSHTLVGDLHVHNFLLGGYGNDTIFGGNDGDVIWGDYQPAGQSEREHDRIHAGAGADWIYSSHGLNEIWTGGGADHVALIYGHGTVHCNGSGLKTLVMRALAANRRWQLIGCNDKLIEPYKA